MEEVGFIWGKMANEKRQRAAAASTGNVPYLGQHLRTLDAGRIILPSEWRPAGSARDFMVIMWPVTTREYFLVLPPARWEVLQRNLAELSLADDQAATIERLIGSSTFKRSLDGYGRLPLPEEASRAMGIENEATLVGRMNKFEVWNSARLAGALAKPGPQSIESALKSIKI